MTAHKGGLRAVGDDEKPLSTKPTTVTIAASQGTQRDLLVAMRDRVAKAVENENTAARDLAALSKRLMEIVRDIEAIDARAKQEAKSDDEATDEPFDASAI